LWLPLPTLYFFLEDHCLFQVLRIETLAGALNFGNPGNFDAVFVEKCDIQQIFQKDFSGCNSVVNRDAGKRFIRILSNLTK
jgi:hypothetical protein